METEEWEQTEGPSDSETRSRTLKEYTWDVPRVDAEGNATIKVTHDVFRWESEEVGGQREVYDSRSPSDDAFEGFGAMMGALVGQSYTVTVSPEGKVLAASGMGDLLVGAAGELEGEDKQLVAALLESQFGEEGVKAAVEEPFRFYPQGPVRVGDTWESRMEVPGSLEGELVTRYRLKERSGGTAVIGVESDAAGQATALQVPGGGSAQVSLIMAGTLEVDEASGCLTQGEWHEETSASLAMEGFSMEMSGSSSRVSRLVPKQTPSSVD
jgi:hypothetical protein